MIPSITVVAVTCLKIDKHIEAIQKTVNCLPFRTTKLLIAPYRTGDSSISYKQTPEIMANGKWEIEDFNHFMLARLINYIKTDFALTVHWDGYAINSSKWSNDFLKYDYIGSPWPWWINLKVFLKYGGLKQVVGNGGFSLRSRKWMIVAAALASKHLGESEDAWCCKTMAREFHSSGCKVAPLEVAQQFSYEHNTSGCNTAFNSFGFHGLSAMKQLDIN